MSKRAQIHGVANLEKQYPRLVGRAFRTWLDAPVFALKDGSVSLSRRDVARLSESPCTRAASNLHHACEYYNIHDLDTLHRIGLRSLLRARNIGERAAWLAALILHDHGYDVDAWLDRKDRALNRRGHIHLVHTQTRTQKHG
jgi:hypothetical protein